MKIPITEYAFYKVRERGQSVGATNTRPDTGALDKKRPEEKYCTVGKERMEWKGARPS